MSLAKLSLAAAVAFAACSSGSSGTSSTPGGGGGSGTIDGKGGTVSLTNGPSVDIPAGALTTPTNVTVAQSGATAPTGALTPVFQFGPDGTTFSGPVTVRFPVPGGTTGAAIYWTRLGSTSDYESLTTTISGTTATAQVTHFSRGFVGPKQCPCTPAAPDDCQTGVTSCYASGASCVSTGTAVADGTACGTGNRCSAGSCVGHCVASQTCTPVGQANPCKVYATSCDATGTVTTCGATADKADGTACANGHVCTGGTCAGLCVANQSCTPIGQANPCKVYATSCDTTGTMTICDVAGDKVDGTSCGTGQVCGGGICGGVCVPNQSCTPAAQADPCKTYATSCDPTGAITSCNVTGDMADGVACGTGMVCHAAACIVACVPSQSCTPTVQDPCKIYATSCTENFSVTSCTVSANQPNGTACGTSSQCSDGTCYSVAPGTRIVRGVFKNVFWKDDGSLTAVPMFRLDATWPSAVLVPHANGPYTPLLIADGRSYPFFTVSNVHSGLYFVQMDKRAWVERGQTLVEVIDRLLVPVTADEPDLSSLYAARPDANRGSWEVQARVALDLANLAPLAPPAAAIHVSQIRIVSSQVNAAVGADHGANPAVVGGATSYQGSFDWLNWFASVGFEGFPDASKGDTVYVYQLTPAPIPPGVVALTEAWRATKYAKLNDVTITPTRVPGEQTGSITATMIDAPLTESVTTSARHSQFLALMNAAVPGGVRPGGSGVSVLAVPHAVENDMPLGLNASMALVSYGDTAADQDMGRITFGGFFDPPWKSYRSFYYRVRYSKPLVDGTTGTGDLTMIVDEPISSASTEIVPVLGPVVAPKINGKDATVRQGGVASELTLSWSPPLLGSPTHYVVSLEEASYDWYGVRTITAIVYDTSFRIPDDVCRGICSGTITAVQAPWDAGPGHPYRSAKPYYSTEMFVAPFSAQSIPGW